MAATKKSTTAAKKAAAPVAEKEQPKATAKKAELTKVTAKAMYFDVALNRIVSEGETIEVNAERLALLSGLGLVEEE